MGARAKTVYSVSQRVHNTPLSLGLLTAFARSAGDGALGRQYHFAPGLHSNASRLVGGMAKHGPGVLLFSHYLWNTRELLAISKRVKEAVPGCITIHGGPSVPKYPDACRAYMSEHPHVDIAVRGEGEGVLADALGRLLGAGGVHGWDAALSPVNGITFRSERRGPLVRTADQPRMKDLSVLPSPYLDGTFDGESWMTAILETNRGCPYGCTFCDWGSATLQKVHLFPLERVKEEIEWAGRRRIPGISISDANFGIFERDVEIAEHAIRVKEKYGFPQGVMCLFAKNSTERVTHIARELIRARLIDSGHISIQTTDAETLDAVRRSNIKLSRYESLRRVYQSEQLPVATELIIAMPRQTVESFKNDLQFCFDQRTFVSLIRCLVLPNSPMADPGYMRRHRIEVDENDQVVSTATLTRDQVEHLELVWRFYLALIDHSVLVYLLRFLQQDHGLRAIDVIERIAVEASRGDPALREIERIVHLLTDLSLRGGGPHPRLAAYRWERVYREMRRYFVERYGVADDPALAAVLKVQEAIMPSLRARVPRKVDLPHDVAAYVAALRKGTAAVPPLRSFAPGSLHVSDPLRLRWAVLLSMGRLPLGHFRSYFELHSELSADISAPHFFMLPEMRSGAAVVDFARSAFELSVKRAGRLVDSHQNLRRSLKDSVRAAFRPALG